MKNDFQILEELLHGPHSEVSGRASAPLSAGLKEKIDKFIRGELTETQRAALCAEILRENSALELLAGMIQKNRSAKAKPRAC